MNASVLENVPIEPQELACVAGLRYVNDSMPGIRRLPVGPHFTYRYSSGKKVWRVHDLERIRSLSIPPAWKDVWICRWSNGHLQVTGRDDQGRKQYIYHPRWREASNEIKFGRLVLFGDVLPRIRRRVEKHFSAPADPRQKILAGLVKLLDASVIRVGNEEYVVENGSYGLTTLRPEHLKVNGCKVEFVFPGKGGLLRELTIRDRTLATFLRQCLNCDHEKLFVYENATGELRSADSDDLNGYLNEVSGQCITAKDFRTWKATATVAWKLAHSPPQRSLRARKQMVLAAIDEAADLLGNTRSVCRSYYVCPAIVEGYLAGKLSADCSDFQCRRLKWLAEEEQLTLHLLRRLT